LDRIDIPISFSEEPTCKLFSFSNEGKTVQKKGSPGLNIPKDLQEEMGREVFTVHFKLSLEQLVIKHDPVHGIDNTPRFWVIARENPLIPFPVEAGACPVQGKIKDPQIVCFQMAWIDPMGGVRSSQNDHIGLYSWRKDLFILEWVVRIKFSVHPSIHQHKNQHQDTDKKAPFPQEHPHLPSFLELKIDKRMIIILPKKDKK